MAQQLVALDIAATHVRLVVIEATFRSAEVVSAQTFRLTPDGERLSLLRQIRSALPAHVDSVIATADPKSASTRMLSFPFDDLRKIEAAIDFELESQVPYDIDDLGTTWNVVSRGQGAAQVLAAVAPRQGLIEQIKELEEARLEPRVMVLPAVALAELAPADVDEPVAVVSLGETQTHVAIVGGLHGGLRYARTLRAGGAAVDRALAKAFDIDRDQAKDAKEREAQLLGPSESASIDVRKASETMADGLAGIVRGLATTLKSLPAEQQPARMLITGGLSRLPGMPRYLSEQLGLPVELVDLRASLGSVGCRPAGLGPEYAVAVGAALSMLRRGSSVPLNFRHGDLSYHGDIQVYRGEVVRIAIGLAVVILLAIVGSIVRYTQVSAEEAQIKQGFCDATKKIVGREICDPMAAIATLRGSPGVGPGITIPPYSAAMLFNMMSRVIDSSIDVTFDDLEFRLSGRLEEPDRITGKGEAASFEATEQIVTRLKKHPCVEEAEVSKQRKTRNGKRVEFHLAVKVRCLPGQDLSTPLEVAQGAAPKPGVKD
ncbi:MAG: pilus assembly protein PilM [Myxococcota bacterium]